MVSPKKRCRLSGRRLARAESGIAAVEFALLVPMFLIMMMGIIDVGQMLFAYYELDQAVAAGAEYAALNAANVTSTSGPALATSIATAVSNANGTNWSNNTVVVNNGPTVTVTDGAATSSGTATNADEYYCLTGSSPNWSWGTGYANQLSEACGTPGKYVTITATYAYVPLLQIYNFIQSGTLTQSAAVQTQ
ncbi:MAG TPA: TadE/TadG family type IV pilus assembly protein [Rhizomicrobium sp.]|jgi:Flp pilus assembly protein TadG